MSYYDSRGGGGRGHYVDDRRDDRYDDDSYLNTRPSRDLVPRHRQDSDQSVEEVRRDFPPPNYGAGYGRTRSSEAGYYYDDDYDRRSDSGRSHRHGPHRKTGTSVYYEEEELKRQRVLGRQQKIIAALAGAALAAGGKELLDQRKAKSEGSEVHRSPLASVAIAAGGAFAGYEGADLYNKHAKKEEKKSTYVMHKGRDGHVAEAYYSSDEDDDRGEKEKKGHKNFLESALAAAGVGGALKAFTGGGKDDDRHSDTRSRRGSDSSRRDGGEREKGGSKIQQAAMASLIAGATEAFRVAKEPGGWQGEKAKRIFTVAATAATVDGVAGGGKNSKLALVESVIAGLGVNRALNGSRKNIEKDEVTGRSRSRSRAPSRSGGGGGGAGLAALATAGLGALGAKKIIDSNRSRSRGRADSDEGSPDRHRKRSRSVVGNALAKLGLGGGDRDDDRSRDPSRDRSRGGSRRPSSRGPSRRSDSDGEYEDDRRSRRGGGGGRQDHEDDRSHNGGGGRDRDRARGGGGSRKGSNGNTSDSDLGDSSEDEKRGKKMRGKQILTGGLAAVATIHAAHNVYQSWEKRNARHKAVREGRLSKEEAAKLKSKALLQDAASVGIAALGIKGALSEMKEVREMNHERKEWEEQKELRHEKRLARLKKQQERGSSRRGSSRGYDSYDDGPRYLDGNPYATAALPAPPVGYYDDRR
jgi:hypothetical protein